MLRAEVIQGLLALFGAPRYLEIGVHSGETFHAVTAARKVAVDPAFRFSIAEAAEADPTAEFHPMTSDAYFAATPGDAETFDLVFLDGLHTFEQTLRDLMNALARVRADSIIVIDDVLPNGHPAAIGDPDVFVRYFDAVPGTDRAWMGDVYRLVYFIAAFMPAWSYATVAENHGQLVMWRQPRDVVHDRTVEAVSRIGYTEVALDKAAFQIRPYGEIVEDIRRARGGV